MTTSVNEQLLITAVSIAAGVALGLYYDIIGTLRRLSGKNLASVFWDVLFCFTTGFGLFCFGMGVGKGEMRLYMLIFACIGAILYRVTLSPLWKRVCRCVFSALSRWLRFCFSPMQFAAKKVSFLVKKLFLFFGRWFTIIYNKLVMKYVFALKRGIPTDETQTNGDSDEGGHPGTGRIYYS